MDYGNYRLVKSKTERLVTRGAPLLGMAFMVHRNMINSIKEINPINNKLMTIHIQCANKKYTMINIHAPTNGDNKINPKTTETLCITLENVIDKAPKDDTQKILGYFIAKIGRE